MGFQAAVSAASLGDGAAAWCVSGSPCDGGKVPVGGTRCARSDPGEKASEDAARSSNIDGLDTQQSDGGAIVDEVGEERRYLRRLSFAVMPMVGWL